MLSGVNGASWWVSLGQRWVSLEPSCVPLKEGLGSSIWGSGQCEFGRNRMAR